MDFYECIKTRRSVRKFSNLPLEFDKLTKILEAGNSAPSSGGHQAWRFILCTNKETIRDLKEHCMGQESFDTASAIIIVTGLLEKTKEWYSERGELYTIQNTAAAIQNMLLAAHGLGIGAVWIGAFDEAIIRGTFAIEEEAKPYAILCLGYPDEVIKPKHQVPLNNVVFFNKYGNKIRNLNLALRDYSLELKAKTKEAIHHTKTKEWPEKTKESVKNIKKKLFPAPKKPE